MRSTSSRTFSKPHRSREPCKVRLVLADLQVTLLKPPVKVPEAAGDVEERRVVARTCRNEWHPGCQLICMAANEPVRPREGSLHRTEVLDGEKLHLWVIITPNMSLKKSGKWHIHTDMKHSTWKEDRYNMRYKLGSSQYRSRCSLPV